MGGLVALYYSVGARPGWGAELAPFGLAAAVATAASFTVLQAVDGVTPRYAVHNWASAPTPQKTAAFAAAEVARWTEIGMNSLSYFLAGLTLFLFGLAIALGRVYPVRTTDTTFATGIVKPVDLELGKNGSPYYPARSSKSASALMHGIPPGG